MPKKGKKTGKEPEKTSGLKRITELKEKYHKRYGTRYELFMFLAIGAVGIGVDAAVWALCYYVLFFRHIPLDHTFQKDIALGNAVIPIGPFTLDGWALAQLVSFCCAVTYNFFMNKYFTFEAEGKTANMYTKYFIVAVIAFIIRSLLGVYFIGRGLHPFLTLVLVIILVTAINFLGSKYWAYKGEKKEDKDGQD